jgi:glycosyltransferase involved in cell wall biosynthesis
MNILFVLYGDFTTNSAVHLTLHARELNRLGHSCAVAVPSNLESIIQCPEASFQPVLYADVLIAPESVFPDGRSADIVHAWTPRENIRRFVTSYMALRPTPLIVYLEDHEFWISCRALGYDEFTVVRQTEQRISECLPDSLSHPFRYQSFIGLADAVVLIQDKLNIDVPPWVYSATVMPGVDLDFFSPQVANSQLRKQYGIAENEKVIVYPGGLNGFTKPAIETLCFAVGLINSQGYPCRLLRTGPYALDFLHQLPPEVTAAINDLGVLPRSELPDLLALADVFVQPGKIDPFEDLRLPGKLPELLAMGRPVVMPDVNIAHLFADGVNAVLTRTGTAEEIAKKCIDLFSDSQQAEKIGQAGRLFAEKYFDLEIQARKLANVYKIACENYDPMIAREIWQIMDKNSPVTLLLARKLKLMADRKSNKSNSEVSGLLKEYARYIGLIQFRLDGLDVVIGERDLQINELNGKIDNLNQSLILARESTSWRLMSKIKLISSKLLRIKVVLKGLSNALSMCGGYQELSRQILSAYKNEGIVGIKRRVFLSAAPDTSPTVIRAIWNDYRK